MSHELEGQRGIGMVFEDASLNKCTIQAENSVLLSIPHPSDELKVIERDILMTDKEKQEAIGAFKLFTEVEDFQKYYFPHIRPVKYSKGEHIYEIGEEAR